nr:hypothetical protein [Tanacetum cinerariifolium]
EFWSTAIVHHHSIRFKMDNKKHIVNLVFLREMLHICPRLPSQSFVEPPFEEEILVFLRFLGHSGAIRRLTDVNINKLHQPWRSFAAIINKCLTGKSSGYDSMRLSPAQILWGLYHKRNVDFAYLMWEDFIYQVEHKDTKKSNEMYYPRPKTVHFLKSKQPATTSKAKSLSDLLEMKELVLYQGFSIYPLMSLRKKSLGIPLMNKTSETDVQTPTLVAHLPVSAPTLTPSTIATITTTQQAPTPPTIALSTLLQDLPQFSTLFRFDHQLKTLEPNFSEFMQKNQFAGAVSSILRIVQRYVDQRMNEAVRVAVQIQFDQLHDEAQAENDKFLKTIDVNMQKIIKEQVKELVKVQVSKILPKIEQTANKQLEAEVRTRSSNSLKTSYVVVVDLSEMETVNKQLEAEVRTRSSNSSKTSYVVAVDLSEMERNLYKAFVEAYESDKIILDTYGDTIILKRRRDDDADKDEEPSVGSDRGSKRPSKTAPAEEPMQTTFEIKEPSHPEFETGADDQPIVEPSQHLEWFSHQKKPQTPYRDWNKTFPATHRSIQPWISELAKLSDSRSSFN